MIIELFDFEHCRSAMDSHGMRESARAELDVEQSKCSYVAS
jgi:hypothetical protein